MKAYKDFKNISTIIVILSSIPNQNSKESKKLQAGVFTHHFIRALHGAADIDNDKKVTIKETFKYSSPRIKKETSNQQTPVI